MQEIESIKKEDRKDISNYIATFKDGSTVGVEADTKAEAEKKIEEYLKNPPLTPISNAS